MGRQFMLVDMRVGLILAFALALVQTSKTSSLSSDKHLDEASGKQEYRHRSINVHHGSVLRNSPITSSYKDCINSVKDKSAWVVIMCITRSINIQTHQSAKKRGRTKSNLVFNAAKPIAFSPSADLSVHKPVDAHLDSISEISIPQYDFLDYEISSVDNFPDQKIHQNMAKAPSLHNMKMMPFDFLTPPPPPNTNGVSEDDNTFETTQQDYVMSSSDEFTDQRAHQPKPPSLHNMKMMPFDLLTPPPGPHGRTSHEKVSEMRTPTDEHQGHRVISEKSLVGSQRGGSHQMPTFHHPMMPPLPSVTVKVMSSSEKQPIFVTNVYAPPMVDVFRILSEANYKWSQKHADERNLDPDFLTVYSADEDCVVLKEFAGVVTHDDHIWEIIVEDIHGNEREAGVCIPSSNLHINPGNTIYIINKPRQ